MLDSVLTARDRFLKPDGAILPDLASIYMAGANEKATGLEFWKDVYGFDMSPIAKSIHKDSSSEVMVRPVNKDYLCTKEVCIKTFDLASMSHSDQEFSTNFEIKPYVGKHQCHSIVLWFDTKFSERYCKEAPQVLSTGPADPATHWAQAVLLLPEPVVIADDCGTDNIAIALKGRISMARARVLHRTLDISLEYAQVWSNGTVSESKIQLYSMKVNTK